jgi:hypothetical protein
MACTGRTVFGQGEEQQGPQLALQYKGQKETNIFTNMIEKKSLF